MRQSNEEGWFGGALRRASAPALVAALVAADVAGLCWPAFQHWTLAPAQCFPWSPGTLNDCFPRREHGASPCRGDFGQRDQWAYRRRRAQRRMLTSARLVPSRLGRAEGGQALRNSSPIIVDHAPCQPLFD